MNVEGLYANLKNIEMAIKNKGLKYVVEAKFNYFGDPLRIHVYAGEPYDEKGYWNSSRDFSGNVADADNLLREAEAWVYSLPGEEDRAIELMIKKLNKLAGELPKGSSDLAQAAWAEVYKMLTRKAEHIAKNGLPSPARISNIVA